MNKIIVVSLDGLEPLPFMLYGFRIRRQNSSPILFNFDGKTVD